MFRILVLLGTGALSLIACPSSGDMPGVVPFIGQPANVIWTYTRLRNVTPFVNIPSKCWHRMFVSSKGFDVPSNSPHQPIPRRNFVSLAATAIGQYNLVLHGELKGAQP